MRTYIVRTTGVEGAPVCEEDAIMRPYLVRTTGEEGAPVCEEDAISETLPC